MPVFFEGDKFNIIINSVNIKNFKIIKIGRFY
jgi:hypothetical protein